MRRSEIETPLGQMTAIGDDRTLHFLSFTDQLSDSKREIPQGNPLSLKSVEKELTLYFSGKLKEFKTPLTILGTPFQIRVWQELCKIPFGKTHSYLEVAIAIGKPTAFRAVAQANSANRFPILIPCHRVINTSGALGGYSCGLERKKWLLSHEK
jgi:AraC family transcriptional regulator, regulatory protein of adaptative response / methylated-DNA-[protein]-cysteine methyltransferase